MSIDYERGILKSSKSTGPARLALMILAYHANRDGVCWPRVETIADEMNVTERSAARAIAKLKRLGEVSVRKRGHARSAVYTILLTPINKPDEIDTLDENIPDRIDRLDEVENETNLTELTNKPDNSVTHELKGTKTNILTNTDVLVSRLSPPRAILELSVSKIKKLDCSRETLKTLERLEKEKEKPRKSLLSYLDARLNPVPPAVEAYREITQRYPPRILYDDIAAAVGEGGPNVERWRAVVKNYVGNGWNPTNVNGMLDKFKQNWSGENGTYPQHQKTDRRPKSGPANQSRRNEPGGHPDDEAVHERTRRMLAERRAALGG